MLHGLSFLLRSSLLTLLLTLELQASSIFPLNSSWRFFRGITHPTPEAADAWRQSGFNDASWSVSVAPFHYGEATFSGRGTELTDMQNAYSTVFLRRTFLSLSPSKLSALSLRTQFDDGLAVWINGHRVLTVNAPESDLAATHSALATTTLEFGDVVEYPLPNATSYLVAGTNTLSILLFNSALGSSDSVFDAELVATEHFSNPPSILSYSPPPDPLTNLTSITVQFNRPVVGVLARHFLVSGSPATAVTGSGSIYTFTFPQPPFGAVTVTWGALHNITDLSQPTLRFDAAAAGSAWNYDLIDSSAPLLISRFPVPYLVLGHLSEIEVLFNQPITGLEAKDLLLNGSPALRVIGVGAGPYHFFFNPTPPGVATLSWTPTTDIVSDTVNPKPFNGLPWSYTLVRNPPRAAVVINEILAENLGGLRDEDTDLEDWIEVHNQGGIPISLEGWALSPNDKFDEAWVFPALTLPAGGFAVVFASGKDRPGNGFNLRPHTSFKLNPNGGRLRLLGPELPRIALDQFDFPEQSPNFSYGRVLTGQQSTNHFLTKPSPNSANGTSVLEGKSGEVRFSVERGFFASPFRLSLSSPTPDATLRYTTNGSPPSATNGFIYTNSILLNATRALRVAAFAPNKLPSRIQTQTYLFNLPSTRRLLPVVSLVTASNHLYGKTGIMEYNPRNTAFHGIAWERPVSVEWIRPEDNGGFQTDAGLRIAGGDYIRGLYNYRASNPPENKYSFRLYFRGEYGQGRLEIPLFPGTQIDSFDTIHLRAGMNDNTNPLLKDEFVRSLCDSIGITACHGTFVHVFLNGAYKGIYNPAERVNEDFLKAYHGGGELWDVIGAGNLLLGGDAVAWNALRTASRRDLTSTANYLDVASRMDLENFIDYLLPHIWADNDDWPHNNTRAARERVAGSRFRFYPWDAEFSFESHPVNYDTIANTLSTTSPPWGTADYQSLFNSLKKSYEFRLHFADRIHRAFFNEGPLTDARIRLLYGALKARLAPSISGYRDIITPWISGRRTPLMAAFQRAGFLASSNAPVMNTFGGRVPSGFLLTLTNRVGPIWFTTNGSDPRMAFTSTNTVPEARRFSRALALTEPVRIRARSLNGTNWSALTEATFTPAQIGLPIRFSEIMYHPPGGDAYEFIELKNTGAIPLDLSGFQFNGITYRFPSLTPLLQPTQLLLLANRSRTNAFLNRYPNRTVNGWFEGSLSNGGEQISLLDRAGQVIASTHYGDSIHWPTAADGGGASLENNRLDADPNDPANWQAGPNGGSPGAPNASPIPLSVQLNEIQSNGSADWVELRNVGSTSLSLAQWSLSDDTNPRQFVFPNKTQLAPGAFLRVHSTLSTNEGLLRAPFRLNRSGEALALFDASTNRVDLVSYAEIPEGFTLGRADTGIWTLGRPTPSSANEPVLHFGPSTALAINEFVCNPEKGPDWIELHNSSDLPIGLEGWAFQITNALSRIESPLFIGPNGFLVFATDNPVGANQLHFPLPASGGILSLLDPTAAEINRIQYSAQLTGTVLARLPDDTGPFQSLFLSETPGTSNRPTELGMSLRLVEVAARTTPDWVEVENVSTQPISLSDYRLEVNAPDSPPIRLPLGSGRRLAPRERALIFCGAIPTHLNADQSSLVVPIPLPDHGAVLSLFDTLGRLIDRLDYGQQITNRSLIRLHPNWFLSATNTPGTANSDPAPLGLGSSLTLNEWKSTGGSSDEFIELFNAEALPVNLTHWILTDDPSMRGSTNNPIGPLNFIDGFGFSKFRLNGSEANALGTKLSFRLNSLGETLQLITPSGRIADSIDFFKQSGATSTGRLPDGATLITQLDPSPGLFNRFLTLDADADGLPDDWERANGLNPENTTDALIDTDGDGISNLDEFRSGTRPSDASSAFRLNAERATGNGLLLHFTATVGRSYSILSTGALGEPWMSISQIPSGPLREISVPVSESLRSTRLYRLITPSVP